MASHIPFEIISHKRRVLSLYKRSLRCLESWYSHRVAFRFQAVLMRQRFDEKVSLTNPAEIKKALEDGETELWEKQHPQPKMFAKSIGGNAYGRSAHCPDWVMDFWHPLEKAQYPEYFARREKRKAEYIKMWEEEFCEKK